MSNDINTLLKVGKPSQCVQCLSIRYFTNVALSMSGGQGYHTWHIKKIQRELSHVELSTISIKYPSEDNLSFKKNKNDHFFVFFAQFYGKMSFSFSHVTSMSWEM